ncbi:MAG: hypothetical protein ACRDFC_02485, partial [Ignavibacteria bacterium]
NLKPLNQNTEGIYEAWISFPALLDHDDDLYISLGRFNISPAGQLVDNLGNPKTLRLKYLPPNINSAEDAIVTIELPGDNDTLPGTRLIGGPVTQSPEYLTANLDMKYTDVLGIIAQNFANATAGYILNTPSTISNDSDYFNGLWFCDTLQNSLINGLLTIPDSLDWEYEGWIVKTTDSTYYSIGKFLDPYVSDRDGKGFYGGPDPGYNKPGSDWINNNPPINDLRSSFFQLMITLEPKNELALSTPFFTRVFFNSTIGILQKGEIANLGNVSSALPTAAIRVSKQ